MTPAVETVAAALLQARRDRRPADTAPLAPLLQTPAEAYEVQDRVAAQLGWFAPGVPRHWKSGGPSRDAVLTHAPLPPHQVWTSPVDAREAHFHLRLIEAEVALRLARDVTPADAAALQPAQAAGLVDAMAVSIEVVDSRWQRMREAPPLLKLADLQSHGALALGAWVPFAPRDWAQQECTVAIGAAAPQVFRGTHSLGDPAWLLPTWLRHVTRHGATAPRGTIVTTGTWCGMLEAQAGDRVQVAFDGIGEASIQL
ncbi:MAG: fumarylacetoacetate hydrolase family protein [Ramlibacter sp.]